MPNSSVAVFMKWLRIGNRRTCEDGVAFCTERAPCKQSMKIEKEAASLSICVKHVLIVQMWSQVVCDPKNRVAKLVSKWRNYLMATFSQVMMLLKTTLVLTFALAI